LKTALNESTTSLLSNSTEGHNSEVANITKAPLSLPPLTKDEHYQSRMEEIGNALDEGIRKADEERLKQKSRTGGNENGRSTKMGLEVEEQPFEYDDDMEGKDMDSHFSHRSPPSPKAKKILVRRLEAVPLDNDRVPKSQYDYPIWELQDVEEPKYIDRKQDLTAQEQMMYDFDGIGLDSDVIAGDPPATREEGYYNDGHTLQHHLNIVINITATCKNLMS